MKHVILVGDGSCDMEMLFKPIFSFLFNFINSKIAYCCFRTSFSPRGRLARAVYNRVLEDDQLQCQDLNKQVSSHQSHDVMHISASHSISWVFFWRPCSGTKFRLISLNQSFAIVCFSANSTQKRGSSLKTRLPSRTHCCCSCTTRALCSYSKYSSHKLQLMGEHVLTMSTPFLLCIPNNLAY